MTRVVVCAACKHLGTGLIIPGPRHFDDTMRALIWASFKEWSHDFEQGFIDQCGVFMTREEAFHVAQEARQPINLANQAGHTDKLFSEGLY